MLLDKIIRERINLDVRVPATEIIFIVISEFEIELEAEQTLGFPANSTES